MIEVKKNLERLARHVVQSLYMGDIEHVSKYSSANMRWITADYERVSLSLKQDFDEYIRFLGKQKVSIVHVEYYTILITQQFSLVIGSYYAVGKDRILHNITLLFVMEDSGIKIKYLHLSEWLPENYCHWIKGLDERLYHVREKDLIYLESHHNHVYWHCRDGVIESVGSLKNAETILSHSFIRIHKGFIVHKDHVIRIGRCYVEMDNGDSMLIPEKKFIEIRNQLVAQ
ncbi:LytTR family DNA-binding domain-containing protein [Clostridium boliviensis]|uniref:LytTR family DNA-binding domain-containing protein n=1 Tax=Clostridium boliviensis TaxID=318465 RepID=A0ABU4GKE8_9CLOT|nr:LytTR family DNA-binding domain-containing protein [Clostridium boliviensis]MDW2797413.1 LytTR family DNA-binding domain-containing protein [Clostridium boliviensis]